jgi:isoleucyl-tRNA synthetase
VNISIKANFKTLGAKFGANVQPIAKAVSAANAAQLVHTLRNSATTVINADGVEYEINLDDLVVTETPKEGWSFASHNGESVALDLELTPALIESGLVREIIRAIQEGRKNAGLDISDRIVVSYQANPELASAFANHSALICDEVLALSITDTLDKASPFTSSVEEIGLTFTITRS